MKWTYTNARRNIYLQCEHDETQLMAYMRAKFREALDQEWREFSEEVAVKLRNMQPGEKATLQSKPIVVTIEREAESPPVEVVEQLAKL